MVNEEIKLVFFVVYLFSYFLKIWHYLFFSHVSKFINIKKAITKIYYLDLKCK